MRARISFASVLGFGTFALPLLASAEVSPGLQSGIFGLLTLASRVLNSLVGLFVLAAVVVFFWGLIKYLSVVGEKKQEGLHTMVWGIVAIFVMVSIWGLIRIVQQTFGLDSAQANQAILPAGITPVNTR